LFFETFVRVILLERIDKLGGIGSIVSVKSGFARNYLLPKKKALRANEENLVLFSLRKNEIEETSLKKRREAEHIAKSMTGLSLSIVCQASESGMLFGSVRPQDICASIEKKGFHVPKKAILIKNPIKSVGNHCVIVELHPEVHVDVAIRIMTSQEQETILGAALPDEKTLQKDTNDS
jgi:large subunit ribosomal protein L9